jgi:hypothetical protein
MKSMFYERQQLAVAWPGAPPPSAESAWEAMARQIDGGGLLGGCGSVWG